MFERGRKRKTVQLKLPVCPSNTDGNSPSRRPSAFASQFSQKAIKFNRSSTVYEKVEASGRQLPSNSVAMLRGCFKASRAAFERTITADIRRNMRSLVRHAFLSVRRGVKATLIMSYATTALLDEIKDKRAARDKEIEEEAALEQSEEEDVEEAPSVFEVIRRASSVNFDVKEHAQQNLKQNASRLSARTASFVNSSGSLPVQGQRQGASHAQADEPGLYTTIRATIVADGESTKSAKIADLPAGTTVRVLEVSTLQEEHYVRGRIEDPPGWINLLDTVTSRRWATQANGCLGVDACRSNSSACTTVGAPTNGSISGGETFPESLPPASFRSNLTNPFLQASHADTLHSQSSSASDQSSLASEPEFNSSVHADGTDVSPNYAESTNTGDKVAKITRHLLPLESAQEAPQESRGKGQVSELAPTQSGRRTHDDLTSIENMERTVLAARREYVLAEYNKFTVLASETAHGMEISVVDVMGKNAGSSPTRKPFKVKRLDSFSLDHPVADSERPETDTPESPGRQQFKGSRLDLSPQASNAKPGAIKRCSPKSRVIMCVQEGMELAGSPLGNKVPQPCPVLKSQISPRAALSSSPRVANHALLAERVYSQYVAPHGSSPIFKLQELSSRKVESHGKHPRSLFRRPPDAAHELEMRRAPNVAKGLPQCQEQATVGALLDASANMIQHKVVSETESTILMAARLQAQVAPMISESCPRRLFVMPATNLI